MLGVNEGSMVGIHDGDTDGFAVDGIYVGAHVGE
jgi:hypothetical protein